MRNRRTSGLRTRIYDFISRSSRHPHAQLIYESLKKEIPSLSLGTVYRNLGILIEDAKIQRRDFGDGLEHYDAITRPHYHFLCEQCGTVTDFDMPVQDAVTSRAQKLSPHTITSHTIQFGGVCESCLKTTGRKKRTVH
jgi:Fur family transcriptional regulator, peroxide stress response regulator